MSTCAYGPLDWQSRHASSGSSSTPLTVTGARGVVLVGAMRRRYRRGADRRTLRPMSDGVIERYLQALVDGDWSAFAACLADDGFTRVGPYGDTYSSKTEYVDFLTGLMPTLAGYEMAVTASPTRATAWRLPSCRRPSRSTAHRCARPNASCSSSPTTAAFAGSRCSPSPARPSDGRGERRLPGAPRTRGRSVRVPDFDGVERSLPEHGFAVMRGLYPEGQLAELEHRARSTSKPICWPAASRGVRHRDPRRSRRD